MFDLDQQKRKANALRKSGNIDEALPIYRELWIKTGDEYDGAGLLHCLRKKRLFDEAIVLAKELLNKYQNFNWVRNESIWTFIEGTLNILDDNSPMQIVIDKANYIMGLNPDALSCKVVVFKVLKFAKALNKWKIVNEWVIKLDPNSLSLNSTTIGYGAEGWSDQAQWYNYRINGIIELSNKQSELEEAFILSDKAIELFPKQAKFFKRLKALALSKMGDYEKAAEIYKNLCSGSKTDWWLYHDYAKVLQAQEEKDSALTLMYQSAINNHKLESMVTLLLDIGLMCEEMGKFKEAMNHLLLCKYIRENKGWGIPEKLTATLDKIILDAGDNIPSSQTTAYAACKSEWEELLNKEGLIQTSNNLRKPQKGLTGKVSSISMERPFCFILTNDKHSYFCYKTDLISAIKDGDEVSFDAIPSYDKKKERDSWRAVNVRKINS